MSIFNIPYQAKWMRTRLKEIGEEYFLVAAAAVIVERTCFDFLSPFTLCDDAEHYVPSKNGIIARKKKIHNTRWKRICACDTFHVVCISQLNALFVISVNILLFLLENDSHFLQAHL